MEDIQRRSLIRTGAVLFLIGGLVLAFPLPIYVNVRMALTAHLEGVMNGIMLIVIGLIWRDLRLGAQARTVAFWTGIYGAYANWLGCWLSAIWGASEMAPIAGSGFHALASQEGIVKFLLMTCGIAIILSFVLIVWGLRGQLERKFEH
jgi:hydroxylaminobenzene mutase